MKFYDMAGSSVKDEAMEIEYKAAREIGIVRTGTETLFFRRKLKTYYIPYSEITRLYRKVYLVPAKMCCGSGDLAVENLIVCTPAGQAAEIQLPGTRAAKILIEELKKLVPHAEFTKPAEEEKSGNQTAEGKDEKSSEDRQTESDESETETGDAAGNCAKDEGLPAKNVSDNGNKEEN